MGNISLCYATHEFCNHNPGAFWGWLMDGFQPLLIFPPHYWRKFFFLVYYPCVSSQLNSYFTLTKIIISPGCLSAIWRTFRSLILVPISTPAGIFTLSFYPFERGLFLTLELPALWKWLFHSEHLGVRDVEPG